ncbi:MAG: carboxymuconolactone decarboxylase family protein [Pseudomonadota bacterium]
MKFYEEKRMNMKPPAQISCAVLPERMPPIPLNKLTEAQREVGVEIAAGPRGSVRGPFVPMMRSPGLASGMQQLGEFIRFECALDKRVSALAVLMIARQWTNQYIWDGHTPQAREAGISQTLIDAIAEGWRPGEMSDLEALTYDFITEVYAYRSVSDVTYEKAIALLGEQGLVELMGVAGYFSINAMIMNVARTPLRDGKTPALPPMPHQLAPIG